MFEPFINNVMQSPVYAEIESIPYMEDMLKNVPLNSKDVPETQMSIPEGTTRYGDSWISYKVGSVGVVPVSGMIIPDAPAFATMFGVSPLNIQKADLKAMDEDPDIKDVVMVFNTPGGSTSGLDNHHSFIRSMKTPVHAYCESKMCSAGYFIASATKTRSSSKLGVSGSIGAILKYEKSDDEEMVTYVSKQSPYKVTSSEKSKTRMQEYVDGLADIFIDHIAEGMNIEREKILSDFGQGGILLGEDALKVGMVDKVCTLDELIASLMKDTNIVTTHTTADFVSNNEEEGLSMTLDDLKTKHPELVTALVTEARSGFEAEEAKKKAQEEARVTALDELAVEAKATSPSEKKHKAVDEFIAVAKSNPETTATSCAAELYKALATTMADETPKMDAHKAHGTVSAEMSAFLGATTPNDTNFADPTGNNKVNMASDFEALAKMGVM